MINLNLQHLIQTILDTLMVLMVAVIFKYLNQKIYLFICLLAIHKLFLKQASKIMVSKLNQKVIQLGENYIGPEERDGADHHQLML